MRSKQEDKVRSWQGKNLEIKVLFSRAGVAQQIWVETQKSRLLVDAGDGTVRDLIANDLDPGQLSGLLFTHGHFDHMGGLHSLLGYLRMIGRKETLPVCAPKGCSEVLGMVENFEKCYAGTIPFRISLIEIEPKKKFQLGDFSIEAHPVVHCGSIEDFGVLDPIPAVGYRISCDNEVVAITGDAGSASPLRELVDEADLAIIEATYSKNTELDSKYLEKVHLSEDLAQELGRLAKEFILVHKAG
jgi:ribonuclease BN (tRNA processing enzyme)